MMFLLTTDYTDSADENMDSITEEDAGEKIDSIFNEEFEAKPDYRKYSRCDYESICDAKEVQ